MATVKIVQYTTSPEASDANADLIRDVFAELAEQRPAGLQYASFRLDDGVSFVHVAVVEGSANPLTESPAFRRFQSGIAERCTTGPRAADAELIGDFGLVGGTEVPTARSAS